MPKLVVRRATLSLLHFFSPLSIEDLALSVCVCVCERYDFLRPKEAIVAASGLLLVVVVFVFVVGVVVAQERLVSPDVGC